MQKKRTKNKKMSVISPVQSTNLWRQSRGYKNVTVNVDLYSTWLHSASECMEYSSNKNISRVHRKLSVWAQIRIAKIIAEQVPCHQPSHSEGTTCDLLEPWHDEKSIKVGRIGWEYMRLEWKSRRRNGPSDISHWLYCYSHCYTTTIYNTTQRNCCAVHNITRP